MRKLFLPVLILSLIACCLELDISIPSFPDMANHFNVSEGIIQLTIAYNFLGFCLAALFYGPLSECYGRRLIMLIGNGILLLGAIGCVYSPSLSSLLLFRFIQGIGASTSAVVVFALIADRYKGEKAIKPIGMMNATLTIFMVIAPLLGSFINEALGWRENYLCIALLCLFSWLLLWLGLPETKTTREPFKLKKVVKDYFRLASSYKFIKLALVPSLFYSAYISFVACASFLYIETFGFSLTNYAWHQGAIVASFSLISIFSDRILNKLGARDCVIKGTLFSLLGSLSMVILSWISPQSPYLMTFFMVIFCSGFAICYPIVFSASLAIFPEARGMASSAIMSMRAFLSSAFIGAVGYFYNGKPFIISSISFLAVFLGSLIIFYLLKAHSFSPKTELKTNTL